MSHRLLKSVKGFLKREGISSRPLIVGCSGGPDSKALLYLLHACALPSLHVAHIDHGWREESGPESSALRKEVEGLGIPFHLHSLSREDFREGDLENQGREHRLQFFLRLSQSIGAQGIMLGHHAGDLAEGVLKRVCEGGSLLSLSGMQGRSSYRGMTLYRPLLSFHKQEMIRWLEERSLSFFDDPTNRSPTFLRARMRQEILPYLTQSFGKEIASNLCRLGEEAGEVSAYFDALNASLLRQIDQDRLDLTPFLPLPRLQVEFLFRRWLQREGITLSRVQLKGAVEAALSLPRSAQFCTRLGGFEIKKGVVCLIRSGNIPTVN